MYLKNLFFGNGSNGGGTVNEMLRTGEDLERNGKVLEAYFLYRGLTAANPACKACRSHMGKAHVKLERQGIEVSVIDKNINSITNDKM